MNQSRISDDRSVDGGAMLTSFDLGALEEMDPSLSKYSRGFLTGLARPRFLGGLG